MFLFIKNIRKDGPFVAHFLERHRTFYPTSVILFAMAVIQGNIWHQHFGNFFQMVQKKILFLLNVKQKSQQKNLSLCVGHSHPLFSQNFVIRVAVFLIS